MNGGGDEVARGEVAPEAAAAPPDTGPEPGGDEVARGEVAPEAAAPAGPAPASGPSGAAVTAGDAAPEEAAGVCGGDAPPLVGDVLTGTDLTLAQAAERLEHGDPLPGLTPLQRRLVEEFAEAL